MISESLEFLLEKLTILGSSKVPSRINPFIYSSEGETYESIADAYGLFVKELLKFNDLSEVERLFPGTVVYLQAKKKMAAKGLEMHILEKGETLWQLAQRYAVKMKHIYKLNGWKDDYVPREGESVKLRK